MLGLILVRLLSHLRDDLPKHQDHQDGDNDSRVGVCQAVQDDRERLQQPSLAVGVLASTLVHCRAGDSHLRGRGVAQDEGHQQVVRPLE